MYLVQTEIPMSLSNGFTEAMGKRIQHAMVGVY